MAALHFVRDHGTREQTNGARPTTAFVLSGGGNQAVAQVGMLRALVEHGVVPDVVVGTSAGAINAAAVAADPTPAGVERLAEVWRELHSENIFPGGRVSRAWNVLTRSTHLFDNQGLQAIVDLLPVDRFEDLRIPLRVVATDYESGEEVVLAAGPVRQAVIASAALPGVFPPIHHDGRMLIDGGVVNNVPLRHALMGPMERIFVLNVTGAAADAPPRYPLDVTLRAFAIARNRRYQLERQMVPESIEVVELPRPDDGRSIFDFSGGDIILEEAYALASHHLEGLFTALERSGSSDAERRWYHRFWPAQPAPAEVA